MNQIRTARLIAMTVISILVLTIPVFAADNQVGNWKLNLTKTTYGGPAPKSSTNKIEVIKGGIRLIADGVDADGKPTHDEYTVEYGGKDCPVKGDSGRTIAYKKIDDYTFDAVAKRNGKVTTTARLIYSKDGKTRTVIHTSIDAQGRKTEGTRVYDKQ